MNNKESTKLEKVFRTKKKILIATLYSAEPVILATTKLGPDKLILLIDQEPTEKQKKSLKLIKDSLGKVLEVEDVKTHVYDIVEVAKKGVELIDKQNKEDQIYINITSGRKTKAIGLLFAAYVRHDHIKKIAYNPEEDKTTVIYLPKLSFKLTESQKKVLENTAFSGPLFWSLCLARLGPVNRGTGAEEEAEAEDALRIRLHGAVDGARAPPRRGEALHHPTPQRDGAEATAQGCQLAPQ